MIVGEEVARALEGFPPSMALKFGAVLADEIGGSVSRHRI